MSAEKLIRTSDVTATPVVIETPKIVKKPRVNVDVKSY